MSRGGLPHAVKTDLPVRQKLNDCTMISEVSDRLKLHASEAIMMPIDGGVM
jgi:hypothetical protein